MGNEFDIENFISRLTGFYPTGMIRHIKQGGEIVGSDYIQPGDFGAIFNGSTGRFLCSRARYEQSSNNIHYFTTADIRNKEISYNDNKGPLILIKLDANAPGSEDHHRSPNISLIELKPRTTSKLIAGASYLLTAMDPDIYLSGEYLGTISVKGDGVRFCCFSSICFDLKRDQKVFATCLRTR